MKQPMKMVFSIFDGKITGIAATIIQAVLDKTIDIHYVFSKKFYYDYCTAWGIANDRNNEDQDEVIIPEWIHSLDFINEVRAQKKSEEVFGVRKTRCFSFSGAQIASDVIANILNEFYTNEDVYFNVGAYAYGNMPHILSKPENLTGMTSSFQILSSDRETELEVEFNTLIMLRQPGKDYYMFGLKQTDLYQMYENKVGEELEVEQMGKYRGFMPALLNAIFSDMVHRDIYQLNFFNKEEARLANDNDYLLTICAEDIPCALYTPAQSIIDIYYPQALISLNRSLRKTDIGYRDSKRYVVEKMLELETAQRDIIQESLVWSILDDNQRKMLQDYHQCFIQFLQSRLAKPQIGRKSTFSSKNAPKQKSSREPKYSHCVFNNTTNNNYYPQPVPEPEPTQPESAQEAVLPVVPVRRGTKEITLFKDEERAEKEAQRLLEFLAKHKLSNEELDASKDNSVNQILVCFYRAWDKHGWLSKKASGTALTRFADECGLSITVMEKAHANALNRMISSTNKYPKWNGEIREACNK